MLATAAGIGRRAVDRTLERVGLAERADDLVGGYSLGMRQRLGIAIALLKDPELLVLDEPANGLDPAGIREVRELIRNLGAEGRTVFLSSHLLSEVEQVCDEVAIVAGGRTVAQGAVAEVLASTRPAAMWVKVADIAGAAATLARRVPRRADGDRIRVDVAAERADGVTRALVAEDHFPVSCARSRPPSRTPTSPSPTRPARAPMIRLLVAELQRIAARRLVRVTVLVAVVGIALGGVAAFAFSGSLSQEAYQQRVEEAEARSGQDDEIEACLRAHDVVRGEEVSDEIAEQCFPEEAPPASTIPGSTATSGRRPARSDRSAGHHRLGARVRRSSAPSSPRAA